MLGAYRVRVRNNKNSYAFELRRNLTLLRGESGRGKTTLFEMLHDYNRYGKQSGVTVSCNKEVYALDGNSWEERLRQHAGEIIVIDEDSQFIRSEDFARAVKGSDNYFLLITRDYLPNLPISVDEVYELTGKKNKRFRPLFTEVNRMYDNPPRRYLPFRPEVIVTEDSGSGFDFFRAQAQSLGIVCVSAKGKSNVYRTVNSFPNKNVVAIADGAAFGNEIEGIVALQDLRPRKVAIFLPESFEWIILKSGVVGLYRCRPRPYMLMRRYNQSLQCRSARNMACSRRKLPILSALRPAQTISDITGPKRGA